MKYLKKYSERSKKDDLNFIDDMEKSWSDLIDQYEEDTGEKMDMWQDSRDKINSRDDSCYENTNPELLDEIENFSLDGDRETVLKELQDFKDNKIGNEYENEFIRKSWHELIEKFMK